MTGLLAFTILAGLGLLLLVALEPRCQWCWATGDELDVRVDLYGEVYKFCRHCKMRLPG